MQNSEIDFFSGHAGARISRAFFIFLMAALMIAALLFSFCAPSFAAVAAGGEPTSAERELLDSVNRERAANHLAPLNWNAALANAARAHSDRMAREENISHRFPGEPELLERAIQAGVRYSKVAENVAEGPSLSGIHNGWMHSPGHRANILDPDLDSIGIGVSERNGQLYATQDFARAIQTLSFEEQERRFGALFEAQGFKLERNPAEARKACVEGHADASKARSLYEFNYITFDLSVLPKQIENAIRLGQYHTAAIGACDGGERTRSGMYRLGVLLY